MVTMSRLDPAYLRELRELEAAGAPALLAELIDAYIQDSAKHLAQVRKSLGAKDAPGLERSAHTMKGASGSLGATALTALYAELQDVAHDADWARAAALVPEIETEQAAAEAELRLERNRGHGP